jgi:hypothetical protein
VPTPFYHLGIADDLLAEDTLPATARALLKAQRAAFYFGKTAPDVQSLSGQSRPATHFYKVPVVDFSPPWERMFSRHPELAQPQNLSPARAAFIAGYICHLQADIIWIKDLFIPYFIPLLARTKRKQVGYLHNVLRAYLDQQILPNLQPDLSSQLKSVRPNGWLPFVQNPHLIGWRDYLAGQLAPGAKIETVEVFAERTRMPVESFLELLHSEDRMQAEVFSLIPPEVLVEYRRKLVSANLELLTDYLDDFHP